MLLRLFIAILLLSKTTAFAAVSCDVLLAQAGQETSAITEGLSSSARVYVNLVQLYIKQQGAKAESITNQILNSDQFVNPFANLKGSQEVQLSAAIRKIEAKISANDWQQIKVGIRKLTQSTAAENKDRAEKEEATSYMVEPQFLSTDVKSYFGDFSWQTMNGRVFLAIEKVIEHRWTSEVYEVINGQMSKIPSKTINTFRPVLQVIDDRLYLFSIATSNEVVVHELIDGELKAVAIKSTGGHLNYLDNVNGRLFATSRGSLSEIIDGDLKYISKRSDSLTTMPVTSLHAVDGRILFFLTEFNSAASATAKQIDMFVVGQNGVDQQQTFSFDQPIFSMQWHQSSSGRFFLAIKLADKKLRIYELKNTSLELVSSTDLPEILQPSGFDLKEEDYLHWLEKDEQLYLIVGRDSRLNVFEVSENQISLVGEIEVEGMVTNIMSSPPYESSLWPSDDTVTIFYNYWSNHYRKQLKIFKKLKKSGAHQTPF